METFRGSQCLQRYRKAFASSRNASFLFVFSALKAYNNIIIKIILERTKKLVEFLGICKFSANMLLCFKDSIIFGETVKI